MEASTSSPATGSHAFVGRAECKRILSIDSSHERAAAFATACRINVLGMIAVAGSGHLGTSFSSLDLLTWIHLEALGERDRYFSSKGHDSPALYAVLAALGKIDFDRIYRLRRLGGLPGHPDVAGTPEVVTSTGSLGMGISKAKGFVRANRLDRVDARVYVMTGDGELQEGQIWESLGSAANERMGEITVFVDHNKIQSDTWVDRVSDLGDLEAKFEAFGWRTARCDGNDFRSIEQALARVADSSGPRVVVADTLKGAGVTSMEPHQLPREATALYEFHSGAASSEQYDAALEELRSRLNSQLGAVGEDLVQLELTARREPVPTGEEEKIEGLVAGYGRGLVEAARSDDRVLALDCDLVLDTGLIPFRERFSDRFIECGIAEQDMVSQASALALAGYLPVCHSFASFLTSRPHEQIYNAASEGTKIIYVGSLAGVVPGGPGHSHQAVRDIASMGSIPGMAVIEPISERQAEAAIRWAVAESRGSVYIRLTSVPWPLGFEPVEEELVEGRGQTLRDGSEAVIVAAGPVMVAGAWAAATQLEAAGDSVGVIAMPWLRKIDGEWLAEALGSRPTLVLDNHFELGGLGEAALVALTGGAGVGGPRVHRLGVREIPVSGTNDEVLRHHGLDAESIAAAVAEICH